MRKNDAEQLNTLEKAMMSIIDGTTPVTHVANQLGYSRQWTYTLLARYKQNRREGLKVQSRQRKTTPQNKTPDTMLTLITQTRKLLKKQGFDNGPKSIHAWLQQQGHNPPSESTIYRHLRKEKLISPQPKKRPRNSYIRFQASAPNECWQADATRLAMRNYTRYCEALIFLDDHSRFITAATIHKHVQGHHVTATFHNAITTHGTPESTLTDNGSIFTTRFVENSNLNAFESMLIEKGIEQKNGQPGHPTTQGKIERLNQTLKKWWSQQDLPRNLTEAQKLLNEFVHEYNTHRPHQALNKRTPHTAYYATPKASPQNPTGKPAHRYREDKVDNQGKVSLRFANRMLSLGTGRKYTGQRVRLIIEGKNVTMLLDETNEIIGLFKINPTKQYQPNQINLPNKQKTTQP